MRPSRDRERTAALTQRARVRMNDVNWWRNRRYSRRVMCMYVCISHPYRPYFARIRVFFTIFFCLIRTPRCVMTLHNVVTIYELTDYIRWNRCGFFFHANCCFSAHFTRKNLHRSLHIFLWVRVCPVSRIRISYTHKHAERIHVTITVTVWESRVLLYVLVVFPTRTS